MVIRYVKDTFLLFHLGKNALPERVQISFHALFIQRVQQFLLEKHTCLNTMKYLLFRTWEPRSWIRLWALTYMSKPAQPFSTHISVIQFVKLLFSTNLLLGQFDFGSSFANYSIIWPYCEFFCIQLSKFVGLWFWTSSAIEL